MAGIAVVESLVRRGAHPGKREDGRRRLRLRRLLLLIGAVCFSPVLLPLACLCLPLVCVLALCLRLGRDPPGCRRRRLHAGTARLPLLDRYLDDQMELVGSTEWDFCDGRDEGEEAAAAAADR